MEEPEVLAASDQGFLLWLVANERFCISISTNYLGIFGRGVSR